MLDPVHQFQISVAYDSPIYVHQKSSIECDQYSKQQQQNNKGYEKKILIVREAGGNRNWFFDDQCIVRNIVFRYSNDFKWISLIDVLFYTVSHKGVSLNLLSDLKRIA